MKLYTDFRDWYDHMFDTGGQPFIRFSVDVLSKREQFILLEAAGYQVPQHGILENLVKTGVGKVFVVYYNPNLHAGKGKVLITTQDDTPTSFYQKYASEWIRSDFHFGLGSFSTRILNIGNRQWQIDYASTDKWRSNVGNVSVTVVKEVENLYKAPISNRPLWAIDFINFYTLPIAVDLNTSPAVPKDLLPASQIADLVKYYDMYNCS